TVSSTPEHFLDTVHTLRVANRAMSINCACLRTLNVQDLQIKPFSFEKSPNKQPDLEELPNSKHPPSNGLLHTYHSDYSDDDPAYKQVEKNKSIKTPKRVRIVDSPT